MKRFVAEHSDAPVFQVDAGGLFAPRQKSGYEVRNRALVDGLARLGLAVANLSHADARLLPNGPRQKYPAYVSANVRRAGRLVAPPYVIRLGAKGTRIVFVGLSTDPLIEEPGIQVDDPQATLRMLLPELKQKADSIVLLAYMPNREVVSLAANFPELDAIVCAYEHQPAAPAFQIGKAWILQAEYEGKYVGYTGLEFGAGGRLARPHLPGIKVLDQTVTDHVELAALVARAKSQIPGQ